MTGPSAGKRPREQDWQRYCKERRPLSAIAYQYSLGITTGPASGIIVLDIDDVQKFKQFCRDNGLEISETFRVKTGSGGFHHYFLYPIDGKQYGNRSCGKNGFDVRGIGGQVVAPGSVHIKTGNQYEIENFVDIAEPPAWLLDYSLTGNLPGATPKQPTVPTTTPATKILWNHDISSLPISHEKKALIMNGASVGQRSEAIMAVLNALVYANLTDSDILAIFEAKAIGEKYREKGRSREKWLQSQIEKARSYVTDRADTGMQVVNDHAAETESKVFLPGGKTKINYVGKTLGKLMAAQFFTRNGEIVEVI